MQAALDFQQQTGLAMQESWLAAISAIGGPNGPGDLQSFWGAFLSCDLNQAGGGSLPTGMKVRGC